MTPSQTAAIVRRTVRDQDLELMARRVTLRLIALERALTRIEKGGD